MKILPLLFFFFSISYYAGAQQSVKTRGNYQQSFINNQFLQPQLKTGKDLSIANTKMMDSLFSAIETSWKKVAADSLKKHPMDVTAKDFNNIDAYNYFWTTILITGYHFDMGKLGQHLLIVI